MESVSWKTLVSGEGPLGQCLAVRRPGSCQSLPGPDWAYVGGSSGEGEPGFKLGALVL